MLYCSYLNYMIVLIFLLLLMCNIIFYAHGATSSYFIKYIYDTYSEYITPCTVMTYTTSGAIWVMPPRLRTLRSWTTVSTDRVDNTMDNSQEKITHIVYYPLYMLIMQVDHDFGRMHDYDRMPDSGQKI
jgi:hypothetical protein